jgi:hypothetical protein
VYNILRGVADALVWGAARHGVAWDLNLLSRWDKLGY